jgi:transposase
MTFDDSPSNIADPEVVPKAKRRRFSAEYKRRILEEADNCTEAGQIGALLRREGLYSSHLSTWRRQREKGLLEALSPLASGQGGLSPKKRGRKRKDELEREVARLQRENDRLRANLEQAEMIIEVQKKLSRLLGLATEENGSGRRA